MIVLPACMYVCAPNAAWGVQEEMLEPLNLELQMAVGCHVGAGNHS